MAGSVIMAVEMDVVEQLSDLLANGDTTSLKTTIGEDSFESMFKERGNDIIPVVSYYINEEAMRNNRIVFCYSEKILQKCAESGNPKECLMEFLAQIEGLDVMKFKTLLKPIQTTLLRIPDRKSPLMQCVINVIYNFINSLPLPKYQYFDEKSKLLLDCDDNALQIKDIYSLIVAFYEPFVNEISNNSGLDEKSKRMRLVMIQALLHLLGIPIVHIDLEYHERGSSMLRSLASKIINFITKLQRDPLAFLTLVENNETVTVDEERVLKTVLITSYEIKFSDLSLSSYFYLLFCENMCKTLPYVYDKLYVYQSCLILANTLLQYTEPLVLQKGLVLIKVLIENIETDSVNFGCLASNAHEEVIKLMSNIAVYHEVEENRKLAAELIKKHFSTFEPKGKYYILLNINKIALPKSIVGYFTTLFTDSVRNTFTNKNYKVYFTGKRLNDLLHTFCILNKGAETDLIENKDQIFSVLNLLIFLARRDRNNFTGVWNYVTSISENFLCPLREAIDLSRVHYKLQLQSLDDPLKTEDGADLSVSVGGQVLDRMSTEDKKVVINSGLTVFDLAEHLLSRANECVENKPKL